MTWRATWRVTWRDELARRVAKRIARSADSSLHTEADQIASNMVHGDWLRERVPHVSRYIHWLADERRLADLTEEIVSVALKRAASLCDLDYFLFDILPARRR